MFALFLSLKVISSAFLVKEKKKMKILLQTTDTTHGNTWPALKSNVYALRRTTAGILEVLCSKTEGGLCVLI